MFEKINLMHRIVTMSFVVAIVYCITEVQVNKQNNADLQKQITLQTANLTEQINNIKINTLNFNNEVERFQILEIKNLLNIAQQKISLMDDKKGALEILSITENKIKNSNNKKLYGIQESITKDKATLALNNFPNRNVIWDKLGEIIAEIDALPFKIMPELKTLKEEQKNSSTTNTDKTGLENLKNIVKFRKIDNGIEPMLEDQERAYLKTNIKLLLEQARVALLQREEQLYKNILSTVQEKLNKYFVANNNSATIVTTLADLEQQSIAKNNTLILDSIKFIN